MPLNLQKNLPAIELLKKEHIFVMDSLRASEQDIRPLRVVVLNLMPLKITTETDLVRLLSNTPLQVELDFMKIKGHTPKNTPIEHMQEFYKDFDEMADDFYDGMIVTGAPVEQMPFEEVSYWEEITQIFDWARYARYLHALYLLGGRKRGYTISMGCLNMICRPRCSVSSVIRSGNRLFRSSGGSMTSSSCLIAVIPRFAGRIS